MKKLIMITTLMLFTAQTQAQYYVPYEVPTYTPPATSYNSRTVPQYVPNIDNNGPQVDQRRNMERMNRQLENMNTIRNYELIYGNTYRSDK